MGEFDGQAQQIVELFGLWPFALDVAGGQRALAGAWSCHSLMALSTSTATIAVPRAVARLPIIAPQTWASAGHSDHCRRTAASPMSPPHSAATTTATRAVARTAGLGSAVGAAKSPRSTASGCARGFGGELT